MTEGVPTDTVAPAAEAVSFRFARGVLSFVGSPIERSQNLLVDREDSAEVAAPLAPLRTINSNLEEANRYGNHTLAEGIVDHSGVSKERPGLARVMVMQVHCLIPSKWDLRLLLESPWRRY